MSPDAVAPPRRDLTKFAWLSIAAAIATIALKAGAWWITGSVGLLADAAESVVNLVAAVVALIALKVAAMPADHNHHFGHSKAEYFSAAVEGMMIFIAALVIIIAAVERFIRPAPIENVGIGLAIAVIASVINGVVAWILIRAGRRYRSITLRADGKHLLTDVWTSVGVVLGVILVAVTDWQRLDPVVAFLVGINIIVAGYKLMRESTEGLMDISLSADENDELAAVVKQFIRDDVQIHALRTRQAGHQRFAEMHVLVPGAWTVWQGHDLVEQIEQAVHDKLDDIQITCHLEPLEDPRAYGDFPAEIPLTERPNRSPSTE